MFYGQRFVASMYSRPTDFVSVARAFGIPGHDLGACPHARDVLRDALVESGPVLLRVPIASKALVLPMVAPGRANTEAVATVDT